MQRTLGRGFRKPQLYLPYPRRGRLSSVKEGAGCGHRLSQRREIQGSRARGTQDPSRQWNLHNRITQQRPQTVCRREDPDDMHAYQTRRWRWGTGEGGRCTYQLELVRNDEADLRHPGNLKAAHVMEQAVWP